MSGPLSAFYTASNNSLIRSIDGTVTVDRLSVVSSLQLADVSSGILNVDGNGMVNCARVTSDGFIKSVNGTFTSVSTIPLGNISVSGISDGILTSFNGNLSSSKVDVSNLSVSLQTRLNTVDASINVLKVHQSQTDASLNTVTGVVTSTSSSVSTLSSSVSTLSGNVSTLSSSVSTLSSHLLVTDASVNALPSSSRILAIDASINDISSHLLLTDASVNSFSSHFDILDASVNGLSGGGGGSSGITVDDTVQQIESSCSLDLPCYGNNWAEIYPRTPQLTDLKNIFCSGNGKYVLLGQATGTDPRISTDYGATWSDLSYTATGMIAAAINQDGKYMLIADSNHNVYISTNYGSTWTAITSLPAYRLAMSSTGKFQVTLDRNYAHYSSDYGATWTTSPYFGAGEDNLGLAMSHDGQRVYVLRRNKLRISTDACANWSSEITITQQNGTNGWMPTNYLYEDVACSGDGKVVIFIPWRVGSGYNMVISRDYCSTFSVTTSGVYFGQAVISSCGRYITAGVRRDTGGYSTDGVYFSDDHGATWTQTSNAIGAIVKAGQVYSLATNNTGSIVYACGSVGQGGAYGVFVSKAAGLAGIVSTCIPTNVVPGTMYFEDWTQLLKIWSSNGGGQWITINPQV